MGTTTIGTDDFDILGTIVEATSYLNGSSSPAAGSWRTATAETRSRGLVTSTRILLGEGLVFDSLPIDIATAPQPIVNAAYELAALLVKTPSLADSSSTGQNIASVGAGSAAVSFFAPTEGTRFPFAVMKLIAPYYPTASSGSAITAGSQSSGTGACSRFDSYDLTGGQ